jgi:DNA-directed RNA polymerase specialized sigma24 family protein
MDAQEFFAGEWPAIVPRLRAMLAKAGTPAADRDDLIQETALRLFRIWDTVDPERSPEPLARRIAINAWRDQWRHRGEREVLGQLPEQAEALDTERVALARIEVGEVSRALASMDPAAARTLRVAAGEAESGVRVGTPAAVRMARSRARRALAACLKVASAVAAFVVIGTRTVGRHGRSAVTVGALAGLAFALGGLADTHRTHPPATRWSGTPAASEPLAPHSNMASRPAPRVRLAAAGAPTRRTPVVRHSKPSFYRLHLGPASVGVFLDVHLGDYGARLSRPKPGQLPACVYGTPTATTTVLPHCS